MTALVAIWTSVLSVGIVLVVLIFALVLALTGRFDR